MDKTVVDLSKFGLKMAGNTPFGDLLRHESRQRPGIPRHGCRAGRPGGREGGLPVGKGVELGGQITADLKVSGRMSDM